MDNFVKYEENKIGTDYVCGDIHGCFSDLEVELTKLNFDKSKDRLFTVGDLTDRGLESEKAFEYIDYDWFISVKGNHEDMLVTYISDESFKNCFYQNGGEWVKRVDFNKLKEYSSKIEKLPLIIQVGNYGILHSRLPYNCSWSNAVKHTSTFEGEILWSRDNFRCITEGIEKIYAGHTIHKEPNTFGNLEIIDTGAFLKYCPGYKGRLTVKKIGD